MKRDQKENQIQTLKGTGKQCTGKLWLEQILHKGEALLQILRGAVKKGQKSNMGAGVVTAGLDSVIGIEGQASKCHVGDVNHWSLA